MSTLGKRKQREEPTDSEAHGSTLFVSNLPYTATSTDLQTIFSDLAPVRSAFVVTEQGTGNSKGVGYVAFAAKEDATSAMEEIMRVGLAIQGRNLRVGWADKKKDKTSSDTVNEGDQKDKEKVKKEKEVRPRQPSGPRDPLAIRTVAVSGIPPGVDSKTLWKKFRKTRGAESVEWPVKSSAGVEDPTVAHVLFDTPNNASYALPKLHAHVYKGALLSATIKKRLDGVSKPLNGATQKGPAPSHASRLIVRNLPFDVSEQDLRALFLPYGTIYSIHIPQAAPPPQPSTTTAAAADEEEVKEEVETKVEVPKTLGKGFAFVWMWTKKEAEKAMEGCNGAIVKAGMADELVRDKQVRKKDRREAKKMSKVAAGEGVEGEGDGEKEQGEKYGGARTIAVDWALSKDKWEAEKEKMEVDGEEESDEEEGESDENEDGDSHVGLNEDSDVDMSDANERSDSEEPTKPQLPPPEAGTTLFVRNIPFEATEDELRTLFRVFGPLRYARITMDHELGRSRGTGFACFWNKEDADKAVDLSDTLRAEMTGTGPAAPKKNPFIMPSILTPDPSSASAQSLVLHGRTLDVVRAVTRDQATKLKAEGEKAREKADKRNMYLLREGVILPNTPAASTIPPIELEKRSNSFNARRTLLKSNPALYVSKTRLSIRQLPRTVSEGGLRRMAQYALRAFDRDVKEGKRAGLTEDELDVAHDLREEDNGEGEKDEVGKGKGKPKGKVKQAKIVREHGKVDVKTGLGKSKGYGFLEMRAHADALRVLRWANNNPELKGLWVGWEKEAKELAEKAAGKRGVAKEEVEEGKEKEAKGKGKGGKEKDAKGEEDRETKGTLIVEFSIENVQVVQRRAAKEDAARSSKGKDEPHKPRERLALPKREEDDGSPRKKRRMGPPSHAGGAPSKKEDGEGEKGMSSLGGVIGRKRKERKAKRG
ncbi:RNA-binding domain-containing protein [Peniophora sp. CONT]|nr:RNA-binding domain-containing protein [Peniophora sp. CONT]